MEANDLSLLKLNLQEKSGDVFTDEDLTMLLEIHKNVWLASYHGCNIKATVNANIELPGGMKIAGNSEYWVKLAEHYYSIYVKENTQEVQLSEYKTSMARSDEFPIRRRW